MNDKITIIMPVYNVQRFINESVGSVLIQSTEDGPIEFIIIDDGSTDGSSQMIDDAINGYSGDIDCRVIHKANEGVGNARNNGLDLATGDWIMFIDSDDRLEPDAIKIFRKYMSEYPDADYFQASAYDIPVDEGIQARPEYYKMDRFQPVYIYPDSIYFLYNTHKGPHVTPWAKLYKRSLIGDERFMENLKSSNDFEFNMRVWSNVKYAVCIYEYVYTRNRRSGSIIEGGVSREQMKIDEFNIVRNMIKYYGEHRDIPEDILRYIICRYLTHIVFAYSSRVKDTYKNQPFPKRIINELIRFLETMNMPYMNKLLQNFIKTSDMNISQIKKYQHHKIHTNFLNNEYIESKK